MTNFQRAPRGVAMIGLTVSAALISGISLPGVGSAQTVTSGAGAMEEVIVFGRDAELLRTARAASEGSVGGAEPLRADVVEVLQRTVREVASW